MSPFGHYALPDLLLHFWHWNDALHCGTLLHLGNQLWIVWVRCAAMMLLPAVGNTPCQITAGKGRGHGPAV